MHLSAERSNVLRLAAAQALFQTFSVMVITVSGLIGQSLAPDKHLATLPIAMSMLTAAVVMIPASLFMQRHGRRAGFLVGSGCGIAAGLLAAFSISIGNFWLFVVANALVGGYQAFAQYYRFAAADTASAEFKSRAISWVIAGGIVAAFAGTNIARFTQGIGPAPFTMSFIVMSVLSLVAFWIMARLDIPKPSVVEAAGPVRPISQIMRQPVFLTALMGSVVGYAMMILVMTATPIAMQQSGHAVGASATVIQWHVLGMFLPSFFTGNLIKRFGVLPIMGAGVLLILGEVLLALAGIGFFHFLSGLILLGIAWNFLFIGGTTLLTEACTPAERAKTQAAHDFLMFGAITIASFSSGSLLNAYGWRFVNLSVIPFLIAALAMMIMYAMLGRRAAMKSA
ncbi:MFS transporter [Oxalobacteraceae bacterium R-40]|uniref:MFS transporter n=1 Tax=Keguizhuia sedimenti TaxID=3064264 RepID=A0ABU1BS01_9BURK|nr:MFS transporter [Oxalobacteraceae bacterium R-40]